MSFVQSKIYVDVWRRIFLINNKGVGGERQTLKPSFSRPGTCQGPNSFGLVHDHTNLCFESQCFHGCVASLPRTSPKIGERESLHTSIHHNIIHIYNNVPWDWQYYAKYSPHSVYHGVENIPF